jgi:hypothetical protein
VVKKRRRYRRIFHFGRYLSIPLKTGGDRKESTELARDLCVQNVTGDPGGGVLTRFENLC